MSDFLNWMTIFGIGLIVGGIALLASAFVGTGSARTARTNVHGATVNTRSPQRPAWREMDRADRTRALTQPTVRLSALLADTVRLNHVPPPRPERVAADRPEPAAPPR